MALIGKVVAGLLAAAIFVALTGRALDHEQAVQQRVLTTTHGVTLDCRVDHKNGQAYLNDCNVVRP